MNGLIQISNASLALLEQQLSDRLVHVGSRALTLIVAQHGIWLGGAARPETDQTAVRAAIIEPWSSGQVEGQVHRLKLVKRQMYGRANLDLLKARLMAA